MNKHQQIDHLTKEIVDNLIQQKQFVDQYHKDIYNEIENVRSYIKNLLQQKIPKTTIVEYITKKYAQVPGPTIINIEHTKHYAQPVVSRTVTRRRLSLEVGDRLRSEKYVSSKQSVRSKDIVKNKIKTGPRGGSYYIKNGAKVYVK